MSSETYRVEIDLITNTKQTVDATKVAEKSFADMGRKVESGAKSSAAGMQQAYTVAAGAITAVMASAAVQIAAELVNTGREVLEIERKFQGLVGPENAIAAIERLRTAAQGAATDRTLQDWLNKSLTSGAADSVAEVSDIIELGMQVAGKRGADAFVSAMATGEKSALEEIGLDTNRIDELAAQYEAGGMSAAESFKTALMTVGDEMRIALGDAAGSAVTEIDKVETEWANFVDRVSSGAAQIAEKAARVANDFLDSLESYVGGDRVAQAGQIVAQQYESTYGVDIDNDRMAALAQMYWRNAQLVGGWENVKNSPEWRGAFTGNAVLNGFSTEEALFTFDTLTAALEQATTGAQNLADASTAAATNIGQLDPAAAPNPFRDYLTTQMGVFQRGADWTQLNIIGANRDFYTPQNLEQMTMYRDNAQAFGDYIREQMEAMPDVFGQDDLQQAEAIIRQLQQGVDIVKSGVEAFLNMNLSQALGTDSPDTLQSQTNAALLEQMRASGNYTDEQLFEIERQLELQSGERTALSEKFDNEYLPAIDLIFQEYGLQAGLQAKEAFDEGLRNARASGTTPVDPLALAGWVSLGGNGTGEQFTINQGEGLNEAAARVGLTPDELMSIAGDGRYIHPGTYNKPGGGVMPLEDIPGEYRYQFFQNNEQAPPAPDYSLFREDVEAIDQTLNNTATTTVPSLQTAIGDVATRLDDVFARAGLVDESFVTMGMETVPGLAKAMEEPVTKTERVHEVLTEIDGMEMDVTLNMKANVTALPQWLLSAIDQRIMVMTNGGRT